MTKLDLVAAIATLPAEELKDISEAIKARRKQKGPNEGLLSQFRDYVKAYGFREVRLCFNAVRKEQPPKTPKAKKAPKTKAPAKAKKPAKK